MELLVVFCSNMRCEPALDAYRKIIQNLPGIGIAVMDFSGDDNIEENNKAALRAINQTNKIPAFFWGKKHTEDLVSSLGSVVPENLKSLITTRKNVLDYGWMRNKATLLTLATGAKAIQSFDIDTVPLKDYSDIYELILEVHKCLLKKDNMAVVSGNYFGPRAITTSMFHKVENQIRFLILIKKFTGFDALNPPIVGGAMAINMEFSKIAPLPLLIETTMSDDLFLSYLARLYGWDVQQTCQLVEHQHGGPMDPEQRKKSKPDPPWIQKYFKRILRIVSFMALIRTPEVEQQLKNALKSKNHGGIITIGTVYKNAINEALNELDVLVKYEEHLKPIVKELKQPKVVDEIVLETIEGVKCYLDFIIHWPKFCEFAHDKGPKWVEITKDQPICR